MKQGFAVTLVAIGALAFAPSALANPCPDQTPITNPFLEWGDTDDYFLAPGGDFESGAEGWELDGASLEPGISSDQGTSLAIAPGDSATSPPICVAQGHRHARMFGAAVESRKSSRAHVRVTVIYADGAERVSVMHLDDEWAPTRTIPLSEKDFDLESEGDTSSIQIRFEAVGASTALLDDIFVDPRSRH